MASNRIKKMIFPKNHAAKLDMIYIYSYADIGLFLLSYKPIMLATVFKAKKEKGDNMLKKLFKRNVNCRKSYSQLGEDLIVDFLLRERGIVKPTYIDIGAHDPKYLSNTALFYDRGATGINIEPNPILFDNINKVRKNDINLNCGIGIDNSPLDFYIMNVPTMSTFSKQNADELVAKHGFRIECIKSVEVHSIKYVLNKYNGGVFPDFLSLDAEGMDFDILKTIDYDHNAPKIICVETCEYSANLTGKKEIEIINFLVGQGYRVFADTFINTIFEKYN